MQTKGEDFPNTSKSILDFHDKSFTGIKIPSVKPQLAQFLHVSVANLHLEWVPGCNSCNGT